MVTRRNLLKATATVSRPVRPHGRSAQSPESIPPEQLLSALLLQVFYGIRSERQLMEQLDYNLLYRWFVGLSPDDPVWDPTTFTKNRELQRDNQDGSGASIWMRRGRRACNAGRA